MAISFESIELPVIAHESAAPGPDPEGSRTILDHRFYMVVGKAVAVTRIKPADGKLIPVVFIKPVLGADPHKAQMILQDAGHVALRNTIRSGETRKFKHRLCPARTPDGRQQHKEYEILTREGSISCAHIRI